MADYKQLDKDKEEEKSELIKRWKIDSGLLYQEKYIMYGPDGKHKVPDVINVTLSLPGRFANDVISMLGTAKEQSIIETDDKNIDTTYIEDFRKAAFNAANARLKWELNPWFDFHSSIRGGCAARCIFQAIDGILVPDIAQWDIRYVTYEGGAQGLDWAANKTLMSKGTIESEGWWNNPLRAKATLKDKGNKVLDVWDTEHNEIWLNDDLVLEQPHPFGFTPVVIRIVTLGSMLADEDSLEHQGEGIFFLIREAVPELSRLLSIMQTLNFTTLRPPVGWGSSEGTQAEAPEYDEAMSPGAITPHEIAGGIKEVKFGDAQRSAQLAYAIMDKAIREATVAASDLGIIESPPASGVRAMVAGESRDQLLSPRLGTKALMNQDLADMFTAQVIQIGGSVELGTTRHKRTFQTSKLDGEYEGYYKYTIKSAAVDAGRASLAAAYGDDLSWRTKAETIYQLEDVDGEQRLRNIEMAERLSPAIRMRRLLESLVEDGRDEEAELLSAEMGVTLQQMMAGEMVSPKPEPEQEPKQVLSLFGGGGGRRPETPVEERGE